MTSDQERQTARKARMVAVVIVATMVLWMGAQFLGGKIGLPSRYVFLFDFAAIAALIWALIVTNQIRQARRNGQDDR